jgi:hypothetical protein
MASPRFVTPWRSIIAADELETTDWYEGYGFANMSQLM